MSQEPGARLPLHIATDVGQHPGYVFRIDLI